MTCRKRVIRRLHAPGLIYRAERCRGHLDDCGRCVACGGGFGRRKEKPAPKQNPLAFD